MKNNLQPSKGQETKQVLLTFAFQSFAEKGFDGTSIREIAKRADENPGLIVYYFGNKETLWQEAVDYHFSMVRKSFSEEINKISHLDPRQQAIHLIRTFVTIAALYPEQMSLMVREGMVDNPRLQWLFDRHLKQSYDLFLIIAEQAIANLLLPDIPRIHLYYSLIGAASTIFTAKAEAEKLMGKTLNQTVIEEHANAMVKIFLRDGRLA